MLHKPICSHYDEDDAQQHNSTHVFFAVHRTVTLFRSAFNTNTTKCEHDIYHCIPTRTLPPPPSRTYPRPRSSTYQYSRPHAPLPCPCAYFTCRPVTRNLNFPNYMEMLQCTVYISSGSDSRGMWWSYYTPDSDGHTNTHGMYYITEYLKRLKLHQT